MPCPLARRSRLLLPLALLAAGSPASTRPLVAGEPCAGRAERLGPAQRLAFAGPQGLARDPRDGSLWITSATSRRVRHYGPGLEPLDDGFEAELPPAGAGVPPAFDTLTGIAFHPARDQLVVARPAAVELRGFLRDGTPSGFVLRPDLPRPPSRTGRPQEPFLEGLAADPSGDSGRGSLWVVDSVMTAVYEVDLEGRVLRSFCHPGDPDGCPGGGLAAAGHYLAPVREDGGLVGFDLLGGGDAPRLRRVDLDGVPAGRDIPLAALGGRPAGFVPLRLADPDTGGRREGLLIVVESSGELHRLAIEPPRLRPPLELEARRRSDAVELTWRPTDDYTAVEVLREGAVVARLPGDAARYLDDAPPQGRLAYTVRARQAPCTATASTDILVGPGEVLRSAALDDAFGAPVRTWDIDRDAEGLLWITASAPGGEAPRFLVLGPDLAPVGVVPLAGVPEGALPTGLAWRRGTPGTLFVYDAAADRVLVVDEAGEPAGPSFASGVEGRESDDPPFITAMLHDPGGAGGAGSFWYLDAARGALEERTAGGDLLRRCAHPDMCRDPPPQGSGLVPFTHGLTAVPGTAFGRLEVSGGGFRDAGAKRVLRLDAATCAPLAREVPLSGLQALRATWSVAVHRGRRRDGSDALWAVAGHSGASLAAELHPGPFTVPPPADASGRAVEDGFDVEIAWRADPELDAVEVERDGELVATLPPGASPWHDREVLAGRHRYALRGRRGDARSDDRSFAVRTGPGSIAARVPAAPVRLLDRIARLPDGPGGARWIAAATAGADSGRLWLLGPDLRPRGDLPSPLGPLRRPAGIAVRKAGRSTEVWVLGWNVGAGPGENRELPLVAVDLEGRVLRRRGVRPPPPPPGRVAFPAGLAWDAERDTLWLHARNARRLVEVAPGDATVLRSVPHPAVPLHDGVEAGGLAVHPATGTLWLPAAGPADDRITRLVEATRTGRLTGAVVPVGDGFARTEGVAVDADGTGFVVASRSVALVELVHHRAFAPLPPPRDARCDWTAEGVHLAWTPSGEADALEVRRDGTPVASLPPAAAEFLDHDAPGCGAVWRIVPRRDGRDGPAAVCAAGPRRPFLRGDAEENGAVNVSDPIAVLGYLFTGAASPACLDAADADDNGTVDVTDAVRLLGWLFLPGRPPPSAPFPEPGCDPTDDTLSCGR